MAALKKNFNFAGTDVHGAGLYTDCERTATAGRN